MMMKRIGYSLSLAAVAFLWASCASTPQTRIEKNPEAYSILSPSDQEKVEKGKIEKGMSKEAVTLALGEPDKVVAGDSDEGAYEEWRYFRLRPVMTHYGYYGFGYGSRLRCGSRYGSGLGWGIGPRVTYIPTSAGVVRFSGDYVDEFKVTAR